MRSVFEWVYLSWKCEKILRDDPCDYVSSLKGPSKVLHIPHLLLTSTSILIFPSFLFHLKVTSDFLNKPPTPKKVTLQLFLYILIRVILTSITQNPLFFISDFIFFPKLQSLSFFCYPNMLKLSIFFLFVLLLLSRPDKFVWALWTSDPEALVLRYWSTQMQLLNTKNSSLTCEQDQNIRENGN